MALVPEEPCTQIQGDEARLLMSSKPQCLEGALGFYDVPPGLAFQTCHGRDAPTFSQMSSKSFSHGTWLACVQSNLIHPGALLHHTLDAS